MKTTLLAITLCVTAMAQTKDAPKAAAAKPNLMDPSTMKAQAPATFLVQFDTTKGMFTIKVTRSWAPNGADRFYNLVRA